MFKSQITHYNSTNQADAAKEIMERLPQLKKKFYLSDIFKAVYLLILKLQGKGSDVITSAQKLKGYMGKLMFFYSILKKEIWHHIKMSTPLFLHQNALSILKVFM